MFYDQLATAIENAGRNQLDDLSSQVWRAYAAGSLADDRAQQLYELIQCKRRPLPVAGNLKLDIPPRYFIQRSPEQRSPNRRASIRRRRQHAATGPLPPSLAADYTTGELAVLRVLADEWLAHGVCDLSRNELGARAGVVVTVVKRAVRYAEGCGLDLGAAPATLGAEAPHQRHPSEWIDWLRKGEFFVDSRISQVRSGSACNILSSNQ